MVIYEPLLDDGISFYGSKIVNSLSLFKNIADIIVTNRTDSEINDVMDKVYTRDMFGDN